MSNQDFRFIRSFVIPSHQKLHLMVWYGTYIGFESAFERSGRAK
jgi:hypothetical protein